MISITNNTSITSINGVVLMSIITSGSLALPPPPTFIAIFFSDLSVARWGFSYKSDLLNPRTLRSEDNPAHKLVAARKVAANVELGLRHQNGHGLEAVYQLVVVFHQLHTPV